ncbi:MAG: bifunctional tetrahydrofolate synthase/dihydrofolate synthase [Pseudomonadales bacterium]|nr:bifunctional tetrahydrofolate synthase/dihydrofolate synthase [Pseudomonadales bacterium]
MTSSQHVAPRSDASLDAWLTYISQIHPREIELGLERLSRVAGRLGLSKPAPVVITVAGTNGKGSTVKTLEAVLTASGYSTGAYTSPHILRFNERIRVQGEEAADGEIVACFARIEAVREPESLSYFEFTTLAALLLFDDKCVDFALLEVGLGGRLDAVNLIDPDCCIITNIALDHEDWLGKGRESIGAEKAGILRAATPFVFCDRDPPASVMARAASLGLTPIAIEANFIAHESADHWSFQGQAPNGEIIRRDTLPIPNLFLDNVVGAMQALACLDLLPADDVLRGALNDLGLGGRFEKRQDLVSGRLVILDAAHNVAAAELLARRLKKTFSVPDTRLQIEAESRPTIRLVLAAMADKNIEDIVRALDALVDIWYIAAFEGSRAAGAQEIHARVSTALPKAMIRPYDSVQSAFRAACNDQPDEHAIIVVTGSFHTLAEVAALSDLD